MGGLGVIAWLVIGSAAGWVISRLMVGADDDALRGTAAGMIGGLLGGLAMRLVDGSPEMGATQLSTLVGVLAGSICLTWVTRVATSRRDRNMPVAPPPVRFVSGDASARHREASPLSYPAARDQVIDQLLRDAMAHDAERYDDVGKYFDSVGREVPSGVEPGLVRLRIAMAFWGEWIDARDRGWRPRGGIAKGDWPLLARTVAADLAGDRDVTDARLVPRFDVGGSASLGNRVQSIVARMRVP